MNKKLIMIMPCEIGTEVWIVRPHWHRGFQEPNIIRGVVKMFYRDKKGDWVKPDVNARYKISSFGKVIFFSEKEAIEMADKLKGEC